MNVHAIAAALLEDDEDPKAFIMRAMPDAPKTWGELKKGDVTYDPETGSIEIITGHDVDYGHRGFEDLVSYTQYSPVYAYGNYVQHLRRDMSDKLAPSWVVGRVDKVGDPWQLMVRLNGGKFHPNPIVTLHIFGDEDVAAYREGFRYKVLNNEVGDYLYFRTAAEAHAEQDRQRAEGEERHRE